MSVGSIVDKALGVLDKVAEAFNLKESRKYIERCRQIRLEILNEKAKGDDADQGWIGHLYRELEINMEAMSAEVTAAIADKK